MPEYKPEVKIVYLSEEDRKEWETLIRKGVWWLRGGVIGFFVLTILLMAGGGALLFRSGVIFYIPPILVVLIGFLVVMRIKKLKDKIVKKRREMEEKYGVEKNEEYDFR